MREDLFLKSALHSLSSPEQLDALQQLTPMRAWIALAAIFLFLAAVLGWSVYGRLPVTVSGQGILIREGGVFNVVAAGEGMVSDIAPLRVGDMVRKGQLLGKVAQPVLAERIASQEEEVARLMAQEAQMAAALAELARSAADLRREQGASLERQLQARRQRLEQLAAGTAQPERLALQEEVEALQLRQRELVLNGKLQAAQQEERLQDARFALAGALQTLAALQREHRLQTELVSTHEGRIVEIMVREGDVVHSRQAILSLEIDRPQVEALFYLAPNSSVERLRPGMQARISPVTASKERFGYLLGQVRAVSSYPATEGGMLAMLGNPGLVKEMTRDGPPVSVEVDLLPDPESVNGYRWSSHSGARLELGSGTFASATFVIEHKRPISLVIPAARAMAGV